DTDLRPDRGVETGRQDIGQHGQVADLGEGLGPVRELQQVEIGVGRHDVTRLTSNPAAHVHIAVGAARKTGVYREADAGVARAACAAAPTRDIEWHRDDVPDIEEFNVNTLFDHLAGN